MWNMERNEGYNGNGGGSDSFGRIEHFVQACHGRWYESKSSRGLSSLLRYTFHASHVLHLSKVSFCIYMSYLSIIFLVYFLNSMWSIRKKRPEFTWRLLLLALLSGILGYVNCHTQKKKKRVVSQTLHMYVQTETLFFLFVSFVFQCYIYSCLAKLQPFLLFFLSIEIEKIFLQEIYGWSVTQVQWTLEKLHIPMFNAL